MWQIISLIGDIGFAIFYTGLLLANQGKPARIIILVVALLPIAFFALPELSSLAIKADYPEVFG
jgi:ABC-type bacteriocin/lantibiotic exporter with double-glycine peptidase domain